MKKIYKLLILLLSITPWLNAQIVINEGFESGTFSPIISFQSVGNYTSSPEIVAYKYWLDNDYNNAVAVNIPVQQQVNINKLISMSSLNNGVHNFNIRFKDDAGMWSSVLSQVFFKLPEQNSNSENKIVDYRYWFNEDFNQATNVTLSIPSVILGLAKNINLTQLPEGEHNIHFQFKDTNGMWSVVTSDITEKTITTNIIENSLNSKILVYSNPTNGKVQIDLKESLSEVKVSIHDINGKLVHQTIYKNQQTLEFNFNEPTGIYLMTIVSEMKKTTIRLIKN